MIQKKKFSDAIAANISVRGRTITGSNIEIKRIDEFVFLS